MTKAPSLTTDKKEIFAEAQMWDTTHIERFRKSNRNAWIVAFIACGAALLMTIALMSLAPLKTVEPFVVRVDNNTGVVDIVSRLNGSANELFQDDAQLAIDRYNIWKFIKAYESYNYELRADHRQTVGLMAAVPVQKQFAQITNPNINPSAPITLYSDKTKVNIYIKGISRVGSRTLDNGLKQSTVLIRFRESIDNKNALPILKHWVATMSFVYAQSDLSFEQRLVNPLGFQVTEYRVDPEIPE